MAKFCGKCGSRLDEATGLCPNCDAEKLDAGRKSELDSSEAAESGKDGWHRVPDIPIDKKEAKKAAKKQRKEDKKRRKKEKKKAKRAAMTRGQRVKRFFLKLFAAVLALAILAAAAASALVYFDLVEIPIISSIFGRLDIKEDGEAKFHDNGDVTYRPDESKMAYDEENDIIYFNNLLIVYTYSDLSEAESEELASLVDGEVVGDISGAVNALQILVPESSLEELNAMADRLMEEEQVLYAGYEYPMAPAVGDADPWSADPESADPSRGSERNPGGNDWWAEAVGAYTAWEYSEWCQPVKVGILDSGFDNEHEDLKGQVSFLEDYSENTKEDHGTHVAGIIAAKNNTVGIRGIADQAELICVDWSPAEDVNYLNTGEYVEITKQLVENQVKVINNSWGNYLYSKEGYTRIQYGEEGNGLTFLLEYLAVHATGAYDSYLRYTEAFCERTGLECTVMMIELLLNGKEDYLVVQAAGNGYDNGGDGVDAAYAGFYCAVDEDVYNLLNSSVREKLEQEGVTYRDIKGRIMIVGAVKNRTDSGRDYEMTSFSNFGENVDICAPGEDIFSTAADGQYKNLSGTSMAAPVAAGSAALLWSLDPDLSAPEVKDILLENTEVRAYGVGDGSRYSYPMLNVGMAAKAAADDMMDGAFEESDVPEDAVEFDGHYYYVYDLDTAVTWEEAREYCEEQGGYLATVTSAEEDEFLFTYIADEGYQSAAFGLYGTEGEEAWAWVTGEKLSYENWASGEPDRQGSDSYGRYFEENTDGAWGSGGGTTGPFICEWGEYMKDTGGALEPVRTTSGERDIVLVLDASGSMSGTPMEETKKAAENFINTILEEDASIGIVTYRDSAAKISDFSVDKDYLTEAVADISSGGGTNMESGLAEAEDMLEKSGAKKKIIVLMSDGEPNAGREGEDLIDYADEIKNEDILIYTLGFFENLDGEKSSAQYLMEKMASEGCHYEVASADDLVFFFEDMADQINGQKYIYIRIACPVDVSVTYNGETLDSSGKEQSLRTDFGTLTFEDSEEASADQEESDQIKVLRLKEGPDYDVQIAGTGRGIMNYTIGFMDENGDYSDFRRFEDIKITDQTVIDTVAAVSDESVLNVDEDGDGRYDVKLRAGQNGYGEEVKWEIWVYAAALGGALLLALLLILIFKIRKKKKGKVNS